MSLLSPAAGCCGFFSGRAGVEMNGCGRQVRRVVVEWCSTMPKMESLDHSLAEHESCGKERTTTSSLCFARCEYVLYPERLPFTAVHGVWTENRRPNFLSLLVRVCCCKKKSLDVAVILFALSLVQCAACHPCSRARSCQAKVGHQNGCE